MKWSVVKGGIIAGIIIFIWSIISWMALPWHHKSFKPFKHEQVVSFLLKQNAPKPGVYVIPYPQKGEWKKNKELMEEGPFVFASVRPMGTSSNHLWPMITALISNIICGGFATWMLLKTKGLSIHSKIVFFGAIGLIAALLTPLSDMLWWRFSLCYSLPVMLDLIIGWVLAGVGVAFAVKVK